MRRPPVLPVVGAAVLALGAGLVAWQRPAPAAGTVAGVVVTADTGGPARQVQVTLGAPPGKALRTTVTDDQGRFVFEALPAGSYFLSVSKPGYLDSSYGQKQPGSGTGGTPIELADSQTIENLAVRLWRGGAVSGTIVDDRGDPAYPVPVSALRYVMRAGTRTLEAAQAVLTDERGFYRIGVLVPGEYLIRVGPALPSVATMIALGPAAGASTSNVTASSRGPGAMNVLTTYYPGTVVPDEARTVAIEAGVERSGTDVTTQMVTAASVSGVVTMADGRRVARARLFLVDRGPVLAGVAPREWPLMSDGSFEIPQVPPGRYTIVARAAVGAPGAETGPGLSRTPPGTVDGGFFADSRAELLWAEADLTVGSANVADVTLPLRRGATISGTLAYVGGLPRDPSAVIVGITQIGLSGQSIALASPVPVAVDDAGQFQIAGVPPGRYRWTVSGGLRGWFARSMTVAGRDTLDVPLEVGPGQDITGVVLTLRAPAAEIAGTLEDAAGHPTSGYTVILFPTDPAYWTPGSRRIRAMQTATDGRFSFGDLPGGAYALAAVTDVATDTWFDPAFLRTLGGAAVSVTVEDGARTMQTLRIVR